jgi:WD40 repeat protein
VAFSPDGTLLATVSTDGTVRISKVGTGKTVVTFLALAEDGYATLVSDSGYKIKGDPGDALWWSIKLCRFTPGELDPFVSNLKRLPADAAILSALGS